MMRHNEKILSERDKKEAQLFGAGAASIDFWYKWDLTEGVDMEIYEEIMPEDLANGVAEFIGQWMIKMRPQVKNFIGWDKVVFRITPGSRHLLRVPGCQPKIDEWATD